MMATNTFIELEPMPEAEMLASYTSIEYDLMAARQFAQVQLDQRKEGNWEHSDAFTIAALVMYSRPFVTGVRHRLDKAALDAFTPEQRAKHEYFRAVRDKHVAHSVNAFEESQPVARYWVERVAEEGIEQISCTHNRIVGLSNSDLSELIELATTMSTYVAARLVEERSTVLAIVRQMPLDQVLKGRSLAYPSAADPFKRRPK